jgi:hypothetical protein
MAYPTSNKDRASWWQRHIEQSTKQLDPFFKVGRRILSMFENEASTQRETVLQASQHSIDGTERVKPSLTYAWIEQSIANMLSRKPRFRVQAKRRDSVAGEVPVGRVINYWYDDTDQMHQDRKCLLDQMVYGFGIKKMGWTADIKMSGEDREFLSDSAELQFDDPDEENLWLATGTPTKILQDHDHIGHNEKHRPLMDDRTIADDIKEIIQEHIDEHVERANRAEATTHIDVQEESPFGLRWWPEDFRIDPLARDGLKDARWIAFRSVKPIEEVRDNPNYNRQAVNALQPQRMEDAPDIDSTFQEEDGFGMVTVWEIWARNFKLSGRRRRNVMAVIAEQGAKGSESPVLLRHEDEWPYDTLKGYPSVLLPPALQGVKTWLQKPTLSLAGFDNIQLLVNELLDSFLATIRKQKNIIFYDSNVFQNDEVDIAVASPGDAAIGVPGLSQAGLGSVVPLPFLQIPGDKGQFLSLITSLGDRAAGTPQPIDSGSETATESAIKERRTTAREGLRIDAFEKFQVDTATIIWRLHTQFQPEMEVEIDERAREFSTVDERIVKGAFRFSIDVSSAVTAQALERKQWLDLLNLLSGMVEISVQQGMPPPNLPKIAEQLLVRGYDVMNPEELWPAIEQSIGVENPLAQELQQQIGPNGQQPGPINKQQFAQPAGNEAAQIRESVQL